MKSNIQLKGLIDELKKTASQKNLKIWKRIADDLEKPTRQRRIVNLSKINHFAKENETIIVPGKVLGTGELNIKVNIASYKISKQALDKLKESNCQYYSIMDLVKANPEGKKVRIIG